jgi:hypothetical protein
MFGVAQAGNIQRVPYISKVPVQNFPQLLHVGMGLGQMGLIPAYQT